jgi:mannose-6-phosphate isomerase-like protein (cupin superfamily)
MTGGRGRIVSKPWGHEEIWAATDRYVGKLLRIRQGHRLSLQHHTVKDETLRVLEGRLRLTEGPSLDQLQESILGPGDAFHLPPGQVHRMEALEDVLLVEVSTPELDDVVRHQDDYGRVQAPGSDADPP